MLLRTSPMIALGLLALCVGCGDGEGEAGPLVMLLLDSSGSMERKSGCVCEDLACLGCLPDCATGERNRFTNALEALTGRFREFSCEALSRSVDIGATYDVGYYLPYHRPEAGAQADDGVLDVYEGRVRFGVATFDSADTYAGASRLVPADSFEQALSQDVYGMWSYGSALGDEARVRDDGRTVGAFHYPNCTTDYRMDTGIRGPDADEGALRMAFGPSDRSRVNEAIQRDLLRVRPYGGTPIAAALDDLHVYFTQDPAVLERLHDDPRDRHVVLITDGPPDRDYRDLGCDCAREGDPGDPERCGPAPNELDAMYCPYPAAADAARALRADAAAAVHVVALSVDDPLAQQELDAIAHEGGTDRARLAADGDALRSALDAILEELLPRAE